MEVVGGRIEEIAALGYRVHPVRRETLLDLISSAVSERRRTVIAGANLHGFYMFERCEPYRQLLSKPETVVIVDGMPVIWLLKVLGHAVSRDHRTTWVDWFSLALERAGREGRRVFILGHPEHVLERGLQKARALFPALEIAGHHGFFDSENPEACARVISLVNDFAPDILIVGMGMPRQEIFVDRYAAAIAAPVIGLGGAAFGYFADEQPTPPRWMGRMGLEWAHRLVADPGRMAGRYLVEPLHLGLLVGRRLAGKTFSRPRAD